MEFKFRDRVRVVKSSGIILKPDGTISQSAFFAGTTGAVIRHDDKKGGYLVVLDCPEISAAMGETITAYFSEKELEPAESIAFPLPDQARPGPFEYDTDLPPGAQYGITGYQATKAKANRNKRLGDA